MKKIFIPICVFTSMAFSHGVHPPRPIICETSCTRQQIEKAIPDAIDILIKNNSIEKRWKTADVENIEERNFKKGPGWAIKLKDKTQQKEQKMNLFIIISTKGYLMGGFHKLIEK